MNQQLMMCEYTLCVFVNVPINAVAVCRHIHDTGKLAKLL
jgi:hypothetical protein